MFRTKFRLNERTDIDVESDVLRKKAERRRLPNATVDSLIKEFESVVAPLIESGRLMKLQGGNFNMTRSIKGSGYEVKLEFATQRNQSFLARLKSLIRSH